ncbi:DUF4270 domain-containing protein [Aquimarina rhabdastrellae]
MTNLKKIILKITAMVVVIFAFASCDEDFNSIGTNIVDQVNFNASLYDEATVQVENQLIQRVQTSGLPGNLLGIYEDPVYGKSTYNVLSQVELDRQNPTFGDNAVLDSVVLSLPYFSTSSTETITDSNGETEVITTYTLDSIYGNSPMKLSIYESNYFLRDFDPDNSDAEQRQVYFANDINASIENQAMGTLLYEEASFVPSSNEVILLTPDDNDEDDDPEVTRIAPRFRAKLPVDFFTTKILDKEGEPELSNVNNFRNHFRGIYFKVEDLGGTGNLTLFNINDADIILYYSFDNENDDGTVDRENGTLEMNFANNIVNQIQNDTDISTIVNDDHIYLKGGVGSMATITLFNEDELEELRSNEWLINEVNLTFYVNKNEVTGGASEPERIYLYSLENNLPLIDYSLDPLTNTNTPVDSKTRHLGRLERGENGEGEFYKIKITDHIRRILNEDVDNVKLGLVVSQNVNIITNGEVENVLDNNGQEIIEEIPFASTLSHEGTVLYGPNHSDDTKKLKLNIFYTESN